MAFEPSGDFQLQQRHLHMADRQPRLPGEIVDSDWRRSQQRHEVDLDSIPLSGFVEQASMRQHDAGGRPGDIGQVELVPKLLGAEEMRGSLMSLSTFGPAAISGSNTFVT